MRPQQQGRRQRNRGGNNNRRNQNPLQRSYESNGPDVKIRGNAQTIADKYSQLARDAQSSGDTVMAENYLQHAEHYNRIIMTAQAQQHQQREEREEAQRSDGSDSEGNEDNNSAEAADYNSDGDSRKRGRNSSRNRSYKPDTEAGSDADASSDDQTEVTDASAGGDAEAPVKKRTTRRPRKTVSKAQDDDGSAEIVAIAEPDDEPKVEAVEG